MLSSVDVIYASAESALDRRFTDFLIDKDNKSFASRIVALVVDGVACLQKY